MPVPCRLNGRGAEPPYGGGLLIHADFTKIIGVGNKNIFAEVAELVYALVSKTCAFTGLRVRLPPSAFNFPSRREGKFKLPPTLTLKKMLDTLTLEIKITP